MKKALLMTAAALLAFPAFAEPKPEQSVTIDHDCAQEQVTIYSTHIYNGYSMEEGQARFDADKKRVQGIAGETGAKVRMTSESYSINPMNYDGPNERELYNFSANLTFEVKPASKGKDFFRKLSKAGINASLNYNTNNNCDEPQGE